MSQRCEQKGKLREAVTEVLRRIDRMNREQMEAIKLWDDDRLMEADKQLELAFGEKERLYGALFEHREEHGC